MSEVKRYFVGLGKGLSGNVVLAHDFDAEHALRLEAEVRAKVNAEDCNDAEHKLAAAERQVGELREQLYNAESDARNASALLAEVVEWFDDGVGRSPEEFKLIRKIDRWLHGSEAEGKDHD
jgi:hypothetical protein